MGGTLVVCVFYDDRFGTVIRFLARIRRISHRQSLRYSYSRKNGGHKMGRGAGLPRLSGLDRHAYSLHLVIGYHVRLQVRASTIIDENLVGL